MKFDESVLKQILVNSGLVDSTEFDDALQNARELGKRIDDVLIFRGLISQEGLSELIAEYYKVPYTNIEHLNVPDEVLSIIPERKKKRSKSNSCGRRTSA